MAARAVPLDGAFSTLYETEKLDIALPCPALPYPLPCPALPCPALPWTGTALPPPPPPPRLLLLLLQVCVYAMLRAVHHMSNPTE
jgi:hypothetical protein